MRLELGRKYGRLRTCVGFEIIRTKARQNDENSWQTWKVEAGRDRRREVSRVVRVSVEDRTLRSKGGRSKVGSGGQSW